MEAYLRAATLVGEDREPAPHFARNLSNCMDGLVRNSMQLKSAHSSDLNVSYLIAENVNQARVAEIPLAAIHEGP